MTKTNSIARKASIVTEVICFLLLMGIAAVTRAGETPQRHSPTTQPVVATKANNRETKTVSNILLVALETKIKNLKEQANQAQQLAAVNGGESAANVVAFINQRLELLERMAKLIEQRQTIQVEIDLYQQRLSHLQQKISGAASQTKLE